MTTATTSRLPKYCVYQDGWSEGCRDMAVGDGLTRPSRLLVATCGTEDEARQLFEQISATNRTKTGPLIPGSGRRVAQLSFGKFDPLDFVPRQNRDQESVGKRYAALCGRLYAEAADRRAKLEKGNA